MLCFLVRGRSGGIPINLHQNETRRVVLLLHDIEARDARLLQARAPIGERRLLESFHTLRFDADMNMNNEHGRRIREHTEKLKSGKWDNHARPAV